MAPDNNQSQPTKEEIAFFIKTLWSSLLEPNWKKADLIDLGMAIFSKTPLSQIDQNKFNSLLPYLTVAAKSFGEQIRSKFVSENPPVMEDKKEEEAK